MPIWPACKVGFVASNFSRISCQVNAFCEKAFGTVQAATTTEVDKCHRRTLLPRPDEWCRNAAELPSRSNGFRAKAIADKDTGRWSSARREWRRILFLQKFQSSLGLS